MAIPEMGRTRQLVVKSPSSSTGWTVCLKWEGSFLVLESIIRGCFASYLGPTGDTPVRFRHRQPVLNYIVKRYVWLDGDRLLGFRNLTVRKSIRTLARQWDPRSWP